MIIAPLVAALVVFGSACSKKEETADSRVEESASGDTADTADNPKLMSLQALGYDFGREITLHVGLSDQELDAFFEGMRREANGEDPPSDLQAQVIAAQKFMRDRKRAYQQTQQKEAANMAGTNIEAGKAFIAELAIKENLKKTPSGLYYRITREGEGTYPAATDTVKVHYRGILIDGTEFDSSYSRNAPATFPLNRVIAGWTEGLQLVREGGEIMLYIPSDLGYGNQAKGGIIKPGSTLVFKVELLEIISKEEGT